MNSAHPDPQSDSTLRALQAYIDARPGTAIALPLNGSLAHSPVVAQAMAQRVPLVWDGQCAGRDMRYRVVPVPDPDGVTRRVTAFAEDISEQKRLQGMLHMAQVQLHFVAGHTADVVWQLDSHMHVTDINDADERLRGCPRDAVIGQSFMNLFTPEGHTIIADALARRRDAKASAGTGQALRFEAPQVCQDGRAVWVEVIAKPIVGANGQTEGFNGVTRALDDRRRQEELLKDAQRKLQSQSEEIEQLQANLHEQVLRDPLTGLHNRVYLDETLPRELSRARREEYPLSIILVHVDRFASLVDDHGLPASEAVLRALSLILNLGARDSDLFCRYGNQEFLVALPMMGLDDAEARAELWRTAMGDTPVEHAGDTISVTLSAGIAAFPDNGADVATLLQRAKQAVFRSQQTGHNRVTRSSGHQTY